MYHWLFIWVNVHVYKNKMTYHEIADINSLVEGHSHTSAVCYGLYDVCKYKFCLLECFILFNDYINAIA